MATSKTALRRFLAIPPAAIATLAAAQAHAAAVVPVGSPFVDAALIAAAAGVTCWLVSSAPMIQQPFKSITSWIVLVGAALSIFSRFT